MLLAVCHDIKIAIAYRPDCDCWNCESCRQKLARKWLMRAQYGMQEIADSEKTLSLVTLTFPGHLDAEGTRQRWRDSWPKLSQHARRAATGLSYFYSHEQHEDERLHVHLIVSPYIPSRWWKDEGAKRGFGFMADSKLIENVSGVAYYVCKYLFKADAVPWPKGWRRVSCSRNWPKLPPLEDRWIHHHLDNKISLSAVQEEALCAGYRLFSLSSVDARRVITSVDKVFAEQQVI